MFSKVDVVLTPAAFRGALALSDLNGEMANRLRAANTPYWDLTGHPVISVPIGFTDAGLPLAMQLAARPFEEATVLRVAEAYQRRTTWHLAVPEIAA